MPAKLLATTVAPQHVGVRRWNLSTAIELPCSQCSSGTNPSSSIATEILKGSRLNRLLNARVTGVYPYRPVSRSQHTAFTSRSHLHGTCTQNFMPRSSQQTALSTGNVWPPCEEAMWRKMGRERELQVSVQKLVVPQFVAAFAGRKRRHLLNKKSQGLLCYH